MQATACVCAGVKHNTLVQPHVLLVLFACATWTGCLCVQVPDVTWGDVGGLEDVKQAVLDTIELPLKHR